MKKIFIVLLLLCSINIYAIDSNTTTKILKIEGLKHFEAPIIEDALGVKMPSALAFWKDKTPKLSSDLVSAIPQTLKAFFDSEGFYDATYDIKESNDTVTIHIKENTPVRVGDINISSDFGINDLITFHKGDIFSAKEFIDIKQNIIKSLLDSGYCSYDLDTKAYVDLQKHIVDLRYKLKKGDICKFGDLSIEGLETIDSDIVASKVMAKKGDRFSTKAVEETINKLYGLQAFDSVVVNVDRKIYNVIPVDIKLKEMQKPYHVEYGAGYDTYVGPRVHAKLIKHNFIKDAQRLILQFAWSSQEQLYTAEFFKPVWMSLYGYSVDLDIKGGYSNLEYDGFKEEKTFLDGYVRYSDDRWDARLGMAIEYINISELDDGKPQLPSEGYDKFTLSYPYADIIYDARDDKLNPKYGYYLRLYTEMGLPIASDSSLYLKWQAEARGIYTISNLTMAVVGKIGAISVDGASMGGIPESKKFFGGGSYSNRAYGYNEIGVITSPTSDIVNGAMSMANLSFELNYPIWDKLSIGIFNDNTMLNINSYDFSGDIISSAGFGFRYLTPIGPFKLDIGFNLHNPSQYGIQFQIGQSF
jgi:translocation and assembly module TamA